MKRTVQLATASAAVALLAACGSAGTTGEITHHRTSGAPAETSPSTTATSGATATGATGAAATSGGSAARTAQPSTMTAGSTAASHRPATHDDGSRTLDIPALGVHAPVTSCATQDGSVTPPSDIDAVCLWSESQPFAARTGTSIIVGHSTRSAASVGALEYVRELKVGDTATVAGQTWRVVEVTPGVDKHSLPAWIVDHAGPRQLGLVTCETTSHTRNDIARLVPVS